MDGVDFVEELNVKTNGIRLQVASCGESEDQLALCLHGFPECWYSWRLQMPLLRDLGYRVWAPNLRGYGGSDRPSEISAYAIESLLDDVSGLIEASGARRVVLLGHDWGAVIAWYFAMRRPKEIDRLVIMNVPHPGCFTSGFRNPRQLLKSWYAVLFQLPRLPERMLLARPIGSMFAKSSANPENFGKEVQQVYTDYARIPGAATAMVNYYRALLRGGGGKRQKELGFPVIETPTLMVWGEQDVALTKATTFGTSNYVSDLTLRYLPDASHWVQQDDPETVNEMLAAWLRGDEVPEANRESGRGGRPERSQ